MLKTELLVIAAPSSNEASIIREILNVIRRVEN